MHLVTRHTPRDVNIPFRSPANQHVISADGTHATFFSLESLTPADTGTFGDTYSVPLAGGAFKLLTTSAPSESVNGITNRAGTRTWFTTKAKVLPADKDASPDIYERRADGTVRLISGGTANVPATMIGGLEDGSQRAVQDGREAAARGRLDASGVDFYERRGDGSLHLVTGGASNAIQPRYLGENADGSVVFRSRRELDRGRHGRRQRRLPPPARRSLLLLTPGSRRRSIPNLPA